MSKCIDDLLRLAREGGDFYKYFEENDVPLVDYARFYAKVREEEDHDVKDTVYRCCVPAYFKGERGNNILRSYLQNDIQESDKNRETYDALLVAVEIQHPVHNSVMSLYSKYGKNFTAHLSERQSIWCQACEKLRNDRMAVLEKEKTKSNNDEVQQQKYRQAKGRKETINESHESTESSLDQVLRKRYEDLHKR